MRALDDFLDPDLIARCRQIHRLTAELRQILPPNVSRNCVVSGINADSVSIVAESAAWATRLRYFEPQILRQFRRAGFDCRRLRLSVARPAPLAAGESGVATGPARPRLSRETARALRALAASESDPQLAAALQRLSRHGASAEEG